MSSNILIIGSTGNVGKELVHLLAKNKQNIRAVVRSTSNTEELKKLGIECINADLRDIQSLKEAMKDTDKVFFATPLVPDMVEISSNIVHAAKEKNIKHIVKLSGAGAELEAITLAKWHRAVEKEIEQSGMTYTFLRPNSFMQNFANFSSYTIRDHGVFYAPMGNGKVAFIDARDIANVAFHVLTEDGHENKSYYLSGPEALSNDEIADILSTVTGKTIKYVDISADAARQSMLQAGMPKEIVGAMLELYEINKLGYTSEISSVVKEITGQNATTFETFAREYKMVFVG